MKKNIVEIIFEDNDILAINKTSGIPTLPDRYNISAPSYYTLLKEKYKNNIFVLHRLDIGTSGVLLFAKNPAAHTFISQQFANHTIKKIYTAVLEGVFSQSEQLIDIPLLPNPNKKGGVVPSARGKESITKIKVIERFRSATLVEAELQTGRLHQLRAHTATIGYPLLIDPMYGNHSEFFASSVKRRYNVKKHTQEIPVMTRPTLHANKISFKHINEEIITIIADFPKDLAALLQILRKYNKGASLTT